jgi:hypothetical protein
MPQVLYTQVLTQQLPVGREASSEVSVLILASVTTSAAAERRPKGARGHGRAVAHFDSLVEHDGEGDIQNDRIEDGKPLCNKQVACML